MCESNRCDRDAVGIARGVVKHRHFAKEIASFEHTTMIEPISEIIPKDRSPNTLVGTYATCFFSPLMVTLTAI